MIFQKPVVRMVSRIFSLSIMLALLPISAATAESGDNAQVTTAILKRPQQKDEVISLIQGANGLSVHKEMYVLPLTNADLYHGAQTEIEFQISAKHKILDTNFYFGYTQKSFWQAYDFSNSSPFRETNYNPEVFYRRTTETVLLGKWGMDIGFEHESNGQSGTFSRSWNRVYIAPYLPHENSLWYLKLWYRVPESNGDDNPDILEYTGWGELHFRKQLGNGHLIDAMLRGNTTTGKGAFSMNYSVPGPSDNYFYLLRLWSGYGESLGNYNRPVNRIGLGFILAR